MSTTKSVPTAALHFPVLKDKGGRVWADNRHVTRLLGWKALLFTRPSEFAGVLRRRNPGMSDTEVRRSLWAVLEWRTLRMPADRLLNTSLLSGVPLVVVLASSQVAEFLIPPHDPIALHGATLALFVVTLILAVAGTFTVPVTCAFKLWADARNLLLRRLPGIAPVLPTGMDTPPPCGVGQVDRMVSTLAGMDVFDAEEALRLSGLSDADLLTVSRLMNALHVAHGTCGALVPSQKMESLATRVTAALDGQPCPTETTAALLGRSDSMLDALMSQGIRLSCEPAHSTGTI